MRRHRYRYAPWHWYLIIYPLAGLVGGLVVWFSSHSLIWTGVTMAFGGYLYVRDWRDEKARRRRRTT